MEYTTIICKDSDAEAWEFSLAAKDKETLCKVKLCLERMEKVEEGIVIDSTDIRTLFYEKKSVFAGYIEVSAGTQLKEAVVELAEQLKDNLAGELISALIFIEGDVAFMEAVEAAAEVEALLRDDANLVFGISEHDGQVGVAVLLAAV